MIYVTIAGDAQRTTIQQKHDELVYAALREAVQHDTVRFLMGEAVEYAPGRTARLATPKEQAQEESLRRFYNGLNDAFPDNWPSPYYRLDSVDDAEMVLDGHFTLEQLKAIVAAWEKFQEAQP